jgi:hypothetical protein
MNPNPPADVIENHIITFDFSAAAPASGGPALQAHTPHPAQPAYAARASDVKPELTKFAIMDIDQILQIEHDDSDDLLANSYMARGDATAICGMGGVGKSRLVMQLAMCCRAGRDFLGWETRCADSRWLFLQTENNSRRLQREIRQMLEAFRPAEQEAIRAGLFFNSLQGDHDRYVNLGDLDNRHRIAEALAEFQPNIVVFDPLRAFASDDLNTDHGMLETVQYLERIIYVGDTNRVPIIIHHAGTGRAGIQKVMGYDRSSFARNSKALYNWVRGMINIAPIKPDENSVLVVASGKCNNESEFKPFCIRLNPETMMYELTDEVDLNEWMERLSNEGGGAGSGKEKTAEDLLGLVGETEVVAKSELLKRAQDSGITVRDFQVLLDQLVDREVLHVHEEKRRNARPKVMLSRTPPVRQEEETMLWSAALEESGN